MAAKAITWAAVRWSIVILSAIFLPVYGQQEISLNKTYEILNEASGTLTIGQSPYAVQLSGLEARILRRLIINLASIGLQLEPEGTVSQIQNLDDSPLVALVSSSNFKVKFMPSVNANGEFVKPNRSITAVEGRKLGNVLNGFKDRGIIVEAESF